MTRLDFRQEIPAEREEVWAFFSNPKNLQKLTPPEMNLVPLDLTEIDMYQGMIIRYRIRPFRWLTTEWVTEITAVSPANYFIDEQRIGPYKFWHHQHWFKDSPAGTIVEDIIHYAVPLGILGRWLDKRFITSEINRIFQFRHQQIQRIF